MNNRNLVKNILNKKRSLVFVVVFFTTNSWFFYYNFISAGTMNYYLENQTNLYYYLMVSLSLFLFALNITIFYARGLNLVLNTFILVLCCIFVFFWEQENSSNENNLRYSKLASRVFFLSTFILEILILIFYFTFYFLRKLFRLLTNRTKIRVFVIFPIVLFLTLFLSFLWIYSRREIDFRKGVFGDSSDPSQSWCQLEEDRVLWSNFIPRKIFHYLILSAWCPKNRRNLILSYDEVSDTRTRIFYSCPSSYDNARLRLIPNVNTLTFEEVKKKERNSMESFTVRSMQNRTVVVDLSSSSSSRTQSGDFFYEYDSSYFETIILDCDSSNSEVFIHPRISRLLTDGRKVRVRDGIDASHPNILFVVLDSMSRKRFERDFPETIEYMKRFREPASKANIYQFFKHVTAGYTTRPQFKVLFQGSRSSHLTPIWLPAKEQGYVTVWAEDVCKDDLQVEGANGRVKKGLRAKFDYCHFELFCTEEISDDENWFQMFKGPYRTGRRCEFGKDEHIFLFEYLQDIENLFPNSPKLMTVWINSAHEFLGQGIQWVDGDLVNYFKFLEEKGSFENTIVYLLSDHGNHQGFVYNLFGHGWSEDYLPMLYVFLPKDYEGVFYSDEIMTVNQQKIVTFNDIHWTTKSFFLSDEEMEKELRESSRLRGLNIFTEEIPFDRNCEDIGNRERKCFCVNQRENDDYKSY